MSESTKDTSRITLAGTSERSVTESSSRTAVPREPVFLADEGVDIRIVRALREMGCLVTSVVEEHPGSLDTEIVGMAEEQGAIVITEDRDFGEMILQKRSHAQGVLLLRLHGVANPRKAGLVAQAVTRQMGSLQGCYSVITERLLRIRPLDPAPPDRLQ